MLLAYCVTTVFVCFILFVSYVNYVGSGTLIKVNALTLNEYGDFLAGVFSPLAFLWLIIAMLLQRRELEFQRQSLDMQIEEMKSTRAILSDEKEYIRESVKLQRENILFSRLSFFEEIIFRKAQLLVTTSEIIHPIKGEDNLTSIIKFIERCEISDEHELIRILFENPIFGEICNICSRYESISISVDSDFVVDENIIKVNNYCKNFKNGSI